MDRVAYDALLPTAKAGNALDRLTDQLALRVGPNPDILLVLDAPGEVMFARKGEHSASILEDWRNAYLELSRRLPSARVLDASLAKNTVLQRATGLIWDALTTRCGIAGNRRQEEAKLPLHRWALLDWRFLIPLINPQRVGYGGRLSGEFVSGLRHMDPHAVRIGADVPGRMPQFDVVVLSEPDRKTFEAAVSAVEPGGWVCAQVRRSFFSVSRPWTIAGWKRAFARQGFTDINVDWQVPTLERAVRIVPTASSVAVRHTLSLHKDVRYGTVKALAGKIALNSGVFNLAIPCGTVTGRRQG
ncbi:hypothetical protein [Arthrobacter sp. AD-310]